MNLLRSAQSPAVTGIVADSLGPGMRCRPYARVLRLYRRVDVLLVQ